MLILAPYLLPGLGGHGAFHVPAVIATQALLVGLVWAQRLPVGQGQ